MSILLLLAAFLLVMSGSSALGQEVTPGLVISSEALTVTEDGTQNYTVRLATRPSAEVTVWIRSLDRAAATVLPLRLRFGGISANWNIPQTVTVSGVADPDRVNETVTLRHRASGDNYDAVTGDVTVSVTDNAGFNLDCGTASLAEGATLNCTLTNPGSSAAPWPGVALFHLSSDANRALVKGRAVDVQLGTLTPNATTAFDQVVESSVWWVGQTLVAYTRFDWSGEAAANASRSISINALDDALHEGNEQFYITLTPDGSRNTTALYHDTHKQTITVTDTDTASADTSLASLEVRAPGAAAAISTTLSGTSYTASVAYAVSEVVVTPMATHHGASLVVGADEAALASGGTSRIFQLAAGATTSIPLKVTAEDSTTTRTYTIALTRAIVPDTVSVAIDSFSLECPARSTVGTTLSCTLTNTGSSARKFPVVALIHSSLDDNRATVAEDSLRPASDPAYRDDVSFPNTVRTSTAYEYIYGYGELFSGGSEEYVTYGYEKFRKTDDPGTTPKEDDMAAGATQTISIEIQADAGNGDAARFYVALAPADYTGLKQLIANKVPLLTISPTPTVPAFGDETAPRSVPENTPADQSIGEPVATTDLDGDTLTYRLSGTDAADFSLDTASGQIKTKAALNYEEQTSYSVTVHVYDGEDADGNEDTTEDEDDAIAVTITVTDVNEPPEVSGQTSVSDYAEHATDAVATFSASDPEGDSLTWALAGTDAGDFTLTEGVLSFDPAPDFEAPADANRDNVYTLSVQVSDGKDAAGNADSAVDVTLPVTVTVTNRDEVGAVTFDVTPPQVGRQLTAMLVDPDGGLRSITWTWERSADGNTWAAITTGVSSSGARSSYTPGVDAENQQVRASASYTDTVGPGRTATGQGQVQPVPTVRLELASAKIAESGTGNSTTVRALLSPLSIAQTRVTVTAGAGVTVSGNPLTIAVGESESSGQVTLTARDNTVHGPPLKDVTVGGSATNSDGVMGPASVTLQVEDDDEPPAVATLRLSAAEINESGPVNSASVTATLSHPSHTATTVDVSAVATGAAEAGAFTLSPNSTLTFPANTTASSTAGTDTVTLTATDDEVDAPHQTVRVTLTNPSGITLPAGLEPQLLTIRDDEDTPTLTLTLTPDSVSENGGVGEVSAELKPAPSVATAVTVSAAALSPATADDFSLSPNQILTIPARQTDSSGTVTLTAKNNAVDGPETKQVSVTGTVESYGLGTIASVTKTLTITDDDESVVTLHLEPDSVNENGGQSRVTARLNPVSHRDTVVEVAEAANDFRLSGSPLTIKANQAASDGTATLTAVDNAVDGPETKQVEVTGRVTNRTDVAAPAAVTLEITDDDERGVRLLSAGLPLPAGGLSIREGEQGSYTVGLASEPTAPVTIGVERSGDTAVSVAPSSLTFTPGNWQTVQTVTVSTADDDLENRVPKTATLSHTVTGGDYGENGVGAASVPVTVTDDESPSTTVTLKVSPQRVREGGSPSIVVTGELDGKARDEDLQVEVTVTSDPALSDPATVGDDFESVPAFDLTIPDGAVSGTAPFTLTIRDDAIHELEETLKVGGSTPGLSVTPTTLTITDNEDPPRVEKLAVSEDAILEGGGQATLTVTLSHPSSVETLVGLTVEGGAAAVTLSPSELTIPAGATSGTVEVTAVDKPGDDAHTQVTVLGAVRATTRRATDGRRPATVQLTVIDDDPPEVAGLTSENYPEGETKPVATYTATNPANVRLVWSLAGPDDGALTIQDGVLSFLQAPDHEAQETYRATVQAADETSIPGQTLTGTLDITLRVIDAMGTVALSPSQPRVGAVLTATVDDEVDGVEKVTEWCWARSPYENFQAEVTEVDCSPTTTETYTPTTEDVNSRLRAMATYTDGDGTSKTSQGMSGRVTVRRRPPPPPPPPGGRGGGGPACAADVHGNSAAQATAVGLATATAGAICPAADVDYFLVTAPGPGLLFVDTAGGVSPHGTLWQNAVALASGPTRGSGQAGRLGARVQAGPIVVALRGQGGATGAYTVVVTLVHGSLENPGPASFQSGVGILSGWVCAAEAVELELNGVPQAAAYGTERLDTLEVCGDSDNGFGLLFNWNLLGDGEHDVVALVDGVELGRTTVTVTTLGQEFVQGVEGACVAEDFPLVAERLLLAWQQNQQNFVLSSGREPRGENRVGRVGEGVLENPGPNSFQSGIGVLSGWVCDAETVEVAIGSVGRQAAAYGTERLDTLDLCGDTDNGFGLLFNWNLLGDGEHVVVAYVDEVELGRATVRVTTLGEEFVEGAEGACVVDDFPQAGRTVTLAWQQSKQNFVITDVQ